MCGRGKHAKCAGWLVNINTCLFIGRSLCAIFINHTLPYWLANPKMLMRTYSFMSERFALELPMCVGTQDVEDICICVCSNAVIVSRATERRARLSEWRKFVGIKQHKSGFLANKLCARGPSSLKAQAFFYIYMVCVSRGSRGAWCSIPFVVL